MWNVTSAPIPGPWPALPMVPPWMAGTAAAAVLIGLVLVFVLVAAARRPRASRRPAEGRVRRLHGMRAA